MLSTSAPECWPRRAATATQSLQRAKRWENKSCSWTWQKGTYPVEIRSWVKHCLPTGTQAAASQREASILKKAKKAGLWAWVITIYKYGIDAMNKIIQNTRIGTSYTGHNHKRWLPLTVKRKWLLLIFKIRQPSSFTIQHSQFMTHHWTLITHHEPS